MRQEARLDGWSWDGWRPGGLDGGQWMEAGLEGGGLREGGLDGGQEDGGAAGWMRGAGRWVWRGWMEAVGLDGGGYGGWAGEDGWRAWMEEWRVLDGEEWRDGGG